MNRDLTFSILFVLLYSSILAGEEKSKTPDKECLFAFSGGMIFSAGDFTKASDNLKKGVNFKLQLPTCSALAWSLETGFLFKNDPNETWHNVLERDHDLNAVFLGWFANRSSAFYAVTGLNVKQWKGTYTGVGENYISEKSLVSGEELSTIRMGANLGVGFERKINDFGFTGEMRYRIAPDNANVRLKIIDVCYSIGLKYDINIDPKRKPKFRLPGNRYHLD